MRKLKATRIDLMQVHNLVDVEAHLDTLAAWKREGRVRYVGVTHYTAGHHDAVARIIAARPVDFVQITTRSASARRRAGSCPWRGSAAWRCSPTVRSPVAISSAGCAADRCRRGLPRSIARAGPRSS